MPIPFRSLVLCLAALSAARFASAQCYWQDRDPRGPVSNLSGNPALIYDSARQRTIGIVRGNTWDWDGINWTRQPTAAIGDASASSFDSARGITVLFGGYESSSSGSPAREWTWEFDGAAWVQRQVFSPPPARVHHAMAFDAARNRTVLFGGENGFGVLADTWTWDGATWTLAAAAGPPGRADHRLAFDAARARCILFGGRDATGAAMGDTWEWDGAAWTQITTAGPPARSAHAMAYDPIRSRVLLLGGLAATGQYLADAWEFDGATWSQRPIAGPAARRSGALSYDAARARMYLVGGRNASGTLRDFWSLDAAGQWTQIAGLLRPPPRFWHSMAYDTARRRTILYSGYPFHDQWEWDGQDWSLRTTPLPSSLINTAMSFDSARSVAVLFGGETGPDQTWEWDGNLWTQRLVQGPPGRRSPAMVYDSARRRTVLFGGYDPVAAVQLGDTWEWDGATWQQVAPSGPAPSPRSGHAMAYDLRRGMTVLFGGGSGAAQQETWEWNGAAWQFRSASGPSPRTGHAMAYDTARARTILFGGRPALADTWEWDGNAWTPGPAAGPPGRGSHAMVYDSARGRAVMFGGSPEADTLSYDDTWELVCPCYANCDASTLFPSLNILDFICFLNRFAAGDPYANCDNSTTPPVLNILDFSCFLNRFAAGCP